MLGSSEAMVRIYSKLISLLNSVSLRHSSYTSVSNFSYCDSSTGGSSFDFPLITIFPVSRLHMHTMTSEIISEITATKRAMEMEVEREEGECWWVWDWVARRESIAVRGSFEESL